MSITNGYAALSELKAAIDPTGQAVWSANDDTNLSLAIEAASRWVDEELGTHFYASTETRYYTPMWHDLLLIDDLLSVTSLKTDENWDGVYENTWAITDYILEPRNAAANSNNIKPYRQIRVAENGDYSFPRNIRNSVQIIGSFGYNAGASLLAPMPIRTAALLIAHRLWIRHRAILGVGGTTATGVIIVKSQIQRDSDIMTLLEGIDRRRV